MFQRFLLVSVLVSASLFSLDAFAAPGRSVTIAQINCNGTAVVRTEVGKLEVITISPNMDGCVGPRATTESSVVVTSTGTQSISPAPVVETPSSGSATGSTTDTQKPKFDRANGPLLDLTSKEVGEYKIAKMKEQGIRYANPVRSVRVRQAATKNSTTTTYLMKNDAVVQSGTGSGWTPVQGAEVVVTDTRENTIQSGTGAKAKGYIATKYLRDPNPSDLVRIKQADQAYWSDVAHVQVAHLVNVRANAWYGSKILFVLTDKTPLYVVSTVDNWSEVISDDRVIHGYIRSDFLVIDKAQRVEPKPLLK